MASSVVSSCRRSGHSCHPNTPGSKGSAPCSEGCESSFQGSCTGAAPLSSFSPLPARIGRRSQATCRCRGRKSPRNPGYSLQICHAPLIGSRRITPRWAISHTSLPLPLPSCSVPLILAPTSCWTIRLAVPEAMRSPPTATDCPFTRMLVAEMVPETSSSAVGFVRQGRFPPSGPSL